MGLRSPLTDERSGRPVDTDTLSVDGASAQRTIFGVRPVFDSGPQRIPPDGGAASGPAATGPAANRTTFGIHVLDEDGARDEPQGAAMAATVMLAGLPPGIAAPVAPSGASGHGPTGESAHEGDDDAGSSPADTSLGGAMAGHPLSTAAGMRAPLLGPINTAFGARVVLSPDDVLEQTTLGVSGGQTEEQQEPKARQRLADDWLDDIATFIDEKVEGGEIEVPPEVDSAPAIGAVGGGPPTARSSHQASGDAFGIVRRTRSRRAAPASESRAPVATAGSADHRASRRDAIRRERVEASALAPGGAIADEPVAPSESTPPAQSAEAPLPVERPDGPERTQPSLVPPPMAVARLETPAASQVPPPRPALPLTEMIEFDPRLLTGEVSTESRPQPNETPVPEPGRAALEYLVELGDTGQGRRLATNRAPLGPISVNRVADPLAPRPVGPAATPLPDGGQWGAGGGRSVNEPPVHSAESPLQFADTVSMVSPPELAAAASAAAGRAEPEPGRQHLPHPDSSASATIAFSPNLVAAVAQPSPRELALDGAGSTIGLTSAAAHEFLAPPPPSPSAAGQQGDDLIAFAAATGVVRTAPSGDRARVRSATGAVQRRGRPWGLIIAAAVVALLAAIGGAVVFLSGAEESPPTPVEPDPQ